MKSKEWAHGKSFHVVWTTWKRGDWLLWLCGKMADKKGWPTRKQLILAACSCAETALKFVPEGEERPRIAIETARKWALGKATIEQVREAAGNAADAADAAYAAYAAAYAAYTDAAYAAADAAYAAAYAAAAYAAAADAADAAAYAADADAAAAAAAAYAAAADAAAAAAAAARTKVLAECATIVRRALKEPRP